MRGDERSSPRSSWIAGEASREAAARGVAMEPLPVMLRTRDEAVEVTLAPRGLQRDQEELQEMRSRYMRDRPPRLQQWRLLQDEKELLQPAARSSCVSPLAGNGCENNDQRNVPLTVLRPSRRDMPSRLADASEELYVTMLPRRRAFSAQGG
ncbi:hypothetical protein DQ04_03141090 [Trypanosoma grayi]|uniref:hypothetical protein n=1 Tax=Trypanosoma grayi TaxID=71804 RepID=UPI0004F3F4EA|nr:hypothetical protein DQ04_03141090 [Trypanosoma grayi]KEG10937.1 hypothetical protein DQ04_03141090 [Trypanosoma grayi]